MHLRSAGAVSLGACVLLTISAAVLGGASPAQPDRSPRATDWPEVLGPSDATWPERQENVVWRDDLTAALEEAKETNRPLLVTARCLPCKQCATFDQQVLDGGETLTPVLAQFVTVRLTDAHLFDLQLLSVDGFQDLDNSWWAYFLSPSGEIYAIFGGRDERSDVSRISAAGFERTARRVLDHYYDSRRPSWNLEWSAPQEAIAAAQDLPGFDGWEKQTPWAADQDCLHCHQLAEVYRQPKIEAGSFDTEVDVGIWPYPENVGLTLDLDDGLMITDVEPRSPAAAIGMKSGDRLAVAAGRLLFGQADFRGVLHREANPTGTIAVRWVRDGKVHDGSLELERGWRATNLDWRMSISQGNIGPSCGFGFPLQGPRNAGGAGKMSIKPFFGRDAHSQPAYKAGLRGNHIIVAVDGESPDLASRPFLVWFRLKFKIGDTVTLTVLENGQRRDISYVLEGGP